MEPLALRGWQDSNPRHSALEADVLPLNYTPMLGLYLIRIQSHKETTR